MTAGVVRPTGVTVMAVVAVVAGIMDILAGLGDIGIGGGFLTKIGFGTTLDGIMMVVGLILVAVGVLGLVSGFGLWSEREWAWLIARLWASLCVVIGLVSAGLSLFGTTLTSEIIAAIGAALVPAIAGAVVLWYLYRPQVKAAFHRSAD
jgi:hypothetical protein